MPEYSRAHPSQRYVDLVSQYRRMHAEGEASLAIEAANTFPGFSLLKHAAHIRNLLKKTRCQNILDYGSGKGRQYELRNLDLGAQGKWESIADFWDVDFVHCYDPAYAPFSELPALKFHGVISTDVLEHCPEEDVPWIVDEMFGYAERLVFAVVAIYPAMKRLPSGENAHCTVRPAEWWNRVFGNAASRHPGVNWQLWFDEERDADERHPAAEAGKGP